MSDAIVKQNEDLLVKIALDENLIALKPSEKLAYYKMRCESIGATLLDRPFDLLADKKNGTVKLYPNKNCAAFLRKRDQITITQPIDVKITDKLCIVTVVGTNGKGRSDSAIGVTNINGLDGDKLANAIMKTETKAKNRLTLSLAGLGACDLSEMMPTDTPDEHEMPTGTQNVTSEVIPEQPIATTPTTDTPPVSEVVDAECADITHCDEVPSETPTEPTRDVVAEIKKQFKSRTLTPKEEAKMIQALYKAYREEITDLLKQLLHLDKPNDQMSPKEKDDFKLDSQNKYNVHWLRVWGAKGVEAYTLDELADIVEQLKQGQKYTKKESK